jgi:release factor glutamine methyltransferase
VEISLSTFGSILENLQTTTFQESDTPHLDAQVLLADVTNKPRSWILAHPEARLEPDQQRDLIKKTAQLKAGAPLPYVLGRWEFYGLDFEINPQVLIPRPETELLVERAMDWLNAHPQNRRAMEIGTGSGCIAVSLAVHVPDLIIIATDISGSALGTARGNAAKQGVADRIGFIQSDLFPPVDAVYNLVCANLPYIPTGVLKQLAIFGREPVQALDGGPDGLALIRKLVSKAPDYLAPEGILMLEIEANQGKSAIELTEEWIPGSRITLVPDYAGRDRLLLVQT